MYYIGIDLGGTNIVASVVDEQYRMLSKVKCKTNLPRSAENICDDMARLCYQAIEESGVSLREVESMGIGTPGHIDPLQKIIEFSCNFDFHQVRLADLMAERISLPVYLENDANAAALGELLAGAGKGAGSMVMITLGTGVGGGVIFHNQIYSGFNYCGGELGHTVIEQNGWDCNCGRKGCFEAYSSATGLIRMTKEAMDAHPETVLHDVVKQTGELNAKTAFDAMRMGDMVAKEVVDTYIRYLGCGLTNMVNVFQPEILCLGGGVSNEGDTLLQPLQKIIDAEDYARGTAKRTKLAIAQLGNDAGIIGAAFAFRYQ